MDEQAYQHWQIYHRRIVSGEMLNATEQAAYEAGCRELDEQEQLDGNLEHLRALRRQITEAELKQGQLRDREKELDARSAALEAHLDIRTRQLLCL